MKTILIYENKNIYDGKMYTSTTRIEVPQFSVSRNGGKSNTAYFIPLLTLVALNRVSVRLWHLAAAKYFYFPIGEVVVMSAAFSCGWKPHSSFFFRKHCKRWLLF